MKFSINEQIIKEVMKRLGKVVSTGAKIPILSGILVEAQEKIILFTGSDGTESVIHRVPVKEGLCTVEEEGKAVISKDAFETAKKLKGIITFELDTNVIKVLQEKTVLSFAAMNHEEYPQIASVPQTKPIVLTGKEFEKLVTKTAFAASQSEARPILQGVCMTFSKEGNQFVATDSHRLGKVTIGQSEQDCKVVVPSKVLTNALKTFDLEKEVFLFPGEENLALANGNSILFTRLLSGTYPETSRLIPKEYKVGELVINRQELLDALELLSGMDNVIKFEIGKLFVKISAKGDISTGEREIAYEEFTGEEDFKICFSAQYVMEALRTIESSSIRIGFVGNINPFVITPVGPSNELQLVLPVRA